MLSTTESLDYHEYMSFIGKTSKSLPHERLESDRLVQEISDAKFGWFFTILLLGAAFLLRRHEFVALGFIFISILCGGVTLAAPQKLKPFKKAWLKLGEVLALVVTPVVLSLFYFIVFTPFAYVLRACGVLDSFSIQVDRPTYWQKRDTQREQDQYYFKQQF